MEFLSKYPYHVFFAKYYYQVAFMPNILTMDCFAKYSYYMYIFHAKYLTITFFAKKFTMDF